MISNAYRGFLSSKLEAGGSETTIYLDRVTTLTGETITTSDFADFGRGILVVNPDGDGQSSFPEYISFTTVTGNTLTGATRGLSSKSNSVIAANKRFAPSGTPVILSWGSHNIQDLLDYIDAQVGALTLGSSTVVIATCGENVSAGNLLYLKNDGKWWKTDADTAGTVDNVQLGIAQGAGTADGAITNGVLTQGLDATQSGLTAGTTYYASNTAGAISSTPGTNSKVVGIAKSTTNLYVDFNKGELPSAGEKQALAGTLGSPSSNNRFVTEDSINLSFGDGSDGDVTISSPTTLTRDMYYNNLTVNSTLTTDGYRIFVKGTLTGTGTIDWGVANSGSTASSYNGGAGGAQSGGGLMKNTAGQVGGKGGDGNVIGIDSTVGDSGTIGVTNTSTGGNGGISATSKAGGLGKLGGASTVSYFGKEKETVLLPRLYTPTGNLIRIPAGAGGGGGGGGAASGSSGAGGGGGGGGASGGIVVIIAKVIAGTFTIKAVGGNGGGGRDGYGSSYGGGGGGGAGGAGGVAIVVYGAKTWTGSYNLAGGAGGAKGLKGGGSATDGTDGTAGATGASYEYQIGDLI